MDVLRRRHLLGFVAALLASACGDPKPDPGKKPPAAAAPQAQPVGSGLVFADVPASVRLNGQFRVVVEVRDESGALRDHDDETLVTVRAANGGPLQGTLTQAAAGGRVVFDDLLYGRWEPIQLTASAHGFADASPSAPIPVRPVMRFATRAHHRFVVGENAGKFEIELVDGQGRPVKTPNSVRLAVDPSDVDVADGLERSFAQGWATYASIKFKTAGSKTLVWTAPGVADLIHGVTVFETRKESGLWLPAARVGVEYRAELAPTGAEFRALGDALPKGLLLEPGGVLHGVPTKAQCARFDVLATAEGESPWLSRAELLVYPSRETAGSTIDEFAAPGPFEVASLDETVDVRARDAKAPLRVFYPARGGRVADGVFPLVVFHHGAGIIDAARPRLYDQYDHFLRHWASHGFVVATVDGTDLVWQDGRWVPGSLPNLDAMAENLRAAINHVARRLSDPKFPLAGHVDAARVVVAGHSRGAAAALIASRTDPRIVGGVLVKPLDPANTVGGAAMWTGTLPSKPFLVVAAGNDGDLRYPMVDCLFDRRSAPMIETTILGSLHYFSCAEGGPQAKFDEGTKPTITRAEDWAVTNAYAVAFLKYAALGDVDAAQRLFGGGALTSNLSSAGVVVQSDRQANSILVDDFQDELPGRNRLLLPNRAEGMDVSADEPSLLTAIRTLPETHRRMYSAFFQRPDILAMSTGHRLEWHKGPATYRLELGGLDVHARAVFAMRVRTVAGAFDASLMKIAFVDATGKKASVPLAGHVGAAGLSPRFCDVIVPLGKVAAGADFENLAAVEFDFDGAGALLLDDLRFE